MMNNTGHRRILPDQSSGSGHTFGTPRHPSITEPILSKRVCFYKSGDPQFNGLRIVINNRTFKTFDALLDSLSKKVPLPFGVRNITTPRGIHAICTLDELEDGKSYICSDSRKVKPINLALARKKLRPWYHARPFSSHRRTVQQVRFFPGRNFHKQEPVVMRTPKRLLVLRNGDPTVKHTVVLHKRTTPTFESILEYISDLIQFHVVKLHTPDGRRVDGLPGLILCSGTVVAAGREPFRPANYSVQKPPAPTWLPPNQTGLTRLKALNSKKKPLSYSSTSRNFSSSSERYIVNQIHNSIAERSCDLPSNNTNSVELESTHMRECVGEMESDTCLGDGGEMRDCLLPTEDDIEKSFRVNQDGSMTVEMKVRLTIKEEETVHWTTTLKRSSVANKLNETCSLESEAEQEICSPKSNLVDLESPAAVVDSITKDKTKDNNDEDPPPLSNGALSESSNEEDNFKLQTDVGSPRRAPTPGRKQISKIQGSVESIKSVMEDGIQKSMVGSYTYQEQIENRGMAEQYCMLQQSTTRPVPKARRHGSVEANNINSRNVATFKSAEITESLQIESSGEEITERVLYIHEQQNCQNSFLANICMEEMSSGISFDRPATSERRQLSTTTEFEPELQKPWTASESASNRRAENKLVIPTFLPLKTTNTKATNRKQKFPASTRDRNMSQYREVKKKNKVFSKPKVINKHSWRLGKGQKVKHVKTFSSAGFIKRIYGNKSKSAKTTTRLKKTPTPNRDGIVTTKSSHPNVVSGLKVNTASLKTSRVNVSSAEISQPTGILTRQKSMHKEKKDKNVPYYISESMSLPGFKSSSESNEYVEKWLEKAYINPTAYPGEESNTANNMSGQSEDNDGLVTVTEEVTCLEEKSETRTYQTLKSEPVLGASVKLRVQCFENKPSSRLVEKTTVVQSHATPSTENCTAVGQKNTKETKPVSNGTSSGISPSSNQFETEIPSGSDVEIKSSPFAISLQNAKPKNTELPNTEICVMDSSSVVSSTLYRLSSVSSEVPDNHPLSISPTCDKTISPVEHTMEMTTSIQADIPSTREEAPIPRTPSIKRAPLVSNLSFERKMSLRKACLDKYTLCSDTTSESTTSTTPINSVGDRVLPNDMRSTETQQPIKSVGETHKSIFDLITNPSCCTSLSPISSSSEERMSSPSISSSEVSTSNHPPLAETKLLFSTQKETPSPKPSVKKVKIMTSPSPERKPQTKEIFSDLHNNSPNLSALHDHTPDKTMSPNTGNQKYTKPNTSASTEKKLRLFKPKLQKRPSPYSQTLDMVSPPVRHKSSRKMLSRNLSSDTASESANNTQRKPSQGKHNQRSQSIKPVAELEKTLACETPRLEEGQTDKNKGKVTDHPLKADQEKCVTERETMPQSFNIANQPNMTPVLEKICYSIKSIRQITQNKRRSCLEKSNSLPDFSSHVASTFGSSSQALLAFLSVMTLKEGITNLNMRELNANNVSCAEALKMMDSLREIANIEDSQKLKCSLSNLQQSASKQLLQSWKDFQELRLITEDSPVKACGIEENVISEIMESLDIPENIKEELASLTERVVSESNDEEIMSTKIIQQAELSPNENSDGEISSNVRDDNQDETPNVGVTSIVNRLIDQSKQSNTDNVPPVAETTKHKPTYQATKDDDGHYRQIAVAKCPPAEPNEKQVPEKKQVYTTMVFVEKNGESCKDVDNEENQEDKNQHQSHMQEQSKQEMGTRTGVLSSERNLEKESCRFDTEEHGVRNLCREETISHLEKELTDDDESGPDEKEQDMSSANKDVEETNSCKESVSSSEVCEHHDAKEEQPLVKETEQQRSEGDLSSCENHSEMEEDNYYVELNVSRRESISNPENINQLSPEEEQAEVDCKDIRSIDALCNPTSQFESEKHQEIPKSCMGLNVSVGESTGNSDVDEPSSSEEEQTEVECKEQTIITEESLSDPDEAQYSTEEEEHLDDLPDHDKQMRKYNKFKLLIEETEEGMVMPDDNAKDHHTVGVELSILIENQDSFSKNDNSSLIKSGSLSNSYRFKADGDSGNDHSSCEEQVHIEQPNGKQISSSAEEELNYYEKESSSEEEHVNVVRYIKESYQEAPASVTESEVTKYEKATDKVKHQFEENISLSVAERLSLLEKKVANAQGRKNVTESSAIRCVSQTNAHLESDVEKSPSESPTSQSALCTRSAPQSSLSFSYDSSGVITTEAEGSRVRSIRDMFLAKSATDIQHSHRRFQSPNASELSELKAETSCSGGYQSQNSGELSSGDDDLARKSITKGFVRRTIERLYGKKDANPDVESGERPPSAPKQKKKEHSSIFSPFHTARSKAMSEMSYFSSTNALDTLNEATRCIAFNAQVGPGDSVSIDNESWLLRENALIRKSVSDPIGINKTFTNSPPGEGLCEDTEETNQYSLSNAKSDREDKKTSFSRKCTYFSLPHAGDSDVCQDELSTVSKSSVNGDSITDTKDNPEDTRMWTDRNGTRPGSSGTDFKVMDNKVHPLIEMPSDGEVVVVQPGKGQGVMNRRLQEPDMLDLLYNFCGQHCPIL